VREQIVVDPEDERLGGLVAAQVLEGENCEDGAVSVRVRSAAQEPRRGAERDDCNQDSDAQEG
jgi:hypothetical protein